LKHGNQAALFLTAEVLQNWNSVYLPHSARNDIAHPPFVAAFFEQDDCGPQQSSFDIWSTAQFNTETVRDEVYSR
jgi:hypothetical protein